MNRLWNEMDDEDIIDALIARCPLGTAPAVASLLIEEIRRSIGTARATVVAEKLRAKVWGRLDEAILRDPTLLEVFE